MKSNILVPIIGMLLLLIIIQCILHLIEEQNYFNKSADDICQNSGYEKHTDVKKLDGILNNRIGLECDNKIVNLYCKSEIVCIEYDKWNECTTDRMKLIC